LVISALSLSGYPVLGLAVHFLAAFDQGMGLVDRRLELPAVAHRTMTSLDEHHFEVPAALGSP
jgi:hypothetical protein